MKKRTVACDVEANGLHPDTVWCIVCKDVKTGESFKFVTPSQIHNDFPKFATTVDRWIGHNFIGYDIKRVIHKLIEDPVHIKTSQVMDTLILSRLANYSRQGGHSLEAWGQTLGFAKVQHEDWDSEDEDNQARIVRRCERDVDLTIKVFRRLMKELKGFSHQAVRIEHSVAQICEEIKDNGFYLDMAKTVALRDELAEKAKKLRDLMEAQMPPHVKLIREAEIRYNKDGTVSKQTLNVFDNPKVEVEIHDDNPDMYSVYHKTPFNPDSPSQCVSALDEAGWKPTDLTKSGQSYKVNETNLNTLPDDAPECYKALREFKIASTRFKVVQSWLDSAEQWGDGRVHGTLMHIGAATHRMAHQAPNMANVPSTGAMYGKELRSCLRAPEGYKILGTDAKGIQLRMLAHFMNDEGYTKEVLDGDPHTANLIAMGIDKGDWIEKKQEWSNRPVAKTFIYTWLMNGGDALVGKICTGVFNRQEGKKVKKQFLDGIPSLKEFRVTHKGIADRGYVNMFDGRRIKVEDEHYVMPTYLQGGEAVVMKTALVMWYKVAKKMNIDFKLVAFVHDEWQTEVREDQAELLGEIQNTAIRLAGEKYQLNCPMDGNPMVGDTWADTH